MALATTNPPRYPLICTASPEFFGARRGLFRYGTHPTKGAHTPTGESSPDPSSDSVSLGQQRSLWRKYDKKLFAKADTDLRPNPNDIWGTLAISHRQPIGRGGPEEDLPVSVPKVV